MAKCDCKDWEDNAIVLPNIPIIDGTMVTKRKGNEVVVKKFAYCPFCGKKLKDK